MKTKSLDRNTKLFPARGIQSNPRKRTTKGFRSFSIILRNPGITFEEFRSKGGRRQDVLWDVDHDRLRLA